MIQTFDLKTWHVHKKVRDLLPKGVHAWAASILILGHKDETCWMKASIVLLKPNYTNGEFRWNDMILFSQENALENIFCEILAMLYRPHWVFIAQWAHLSLTWTFFFIPGVKKLPLVPAVEAPESEVIGSLAVTAMIITVALVVLFDIITLILNTSHYINAGIAKPETP